ncbi:MAG: MBL fold metallo-hydrolase [Thermodesulfobacteriota bacterium]
MDLQLLRNATVVLNPAGGRILVDPCLSPKGGIPPFTLFRRPPRLNPVKDLPENAAAALSGVNAALISHFRFGHLDHLDPTGLRFLKKNGIPAFCSLRDQKALAKKGVAAVGVPFDSWAECLGGRIRAVPAVHGYGLIGKLMGPGVGFLLRFPGEPSLYIAGDTVLTDGMRRVLEEERPEVCVINAGGAVLDIGRPILMPIDEVMEFVGLAPGKVVAVHLEALNHCVTTRDMLRSRLQSSGLAGKVLIPEDGETISL